MLKNLNIINLQIYNTQLGYIDNFTSKCFSKRKSSERVLKNMSITPFKCGGCHIKLDIK